MKITPADLCQRRACDEQVAIFAAEWPEGCEVTEATCLRAITLGLNIHWAARHLLPEPQLQEWERQVNLSLEEDALQIAAIATKTGL